MTLFIWILRVAKGCRWPPLMTSYVLLRRVAESNSFDERKLIRGSMKDVAAPGLFADAPVHHGI